MEKLQEYNFVIRHKVGTQNKVGDDLGRRHVLLTNFTMHVVGFEHMRELYKDDVDFGHIWAECVEQRPTLDFYIH